MYGHRPQYITNTDKAAIVMCAQNCQASTGSCFLNDTGNKIFFKINPLGRSPLVWGPVTWEGKSQAHPIQSSNHFKWQWDISGPDMLNEPQPHHAGTTCISWMSKGFHPAILVAFPSETPSALSYRAKHDSGCCWKFSHERCMKTWIHSVLVDSEESLIARIVEAAAISGQKPDTFEPTWQSQLHHCQLGIEMGGCMWEHLL